MEKSKMNQNKKTISVLGAGSWGTAIAHRLSLSPHLNVCLFGRNVEKVTIMQQDRINSNYLPLKTLNSALKITYNLSEALQSEWLILATPLSTLQEWLLMLQNTDHTVINLSKGIHAKNSLLPHEMAEKSWGKEKTEQRFASLLGPSFAHEVAAEQPCALTFACKNHDLFSIAAKIFPPVSIRIYWSEDLIGVELGGALKNVMAIASGICDGLNLGQNARAALIARGLAEIHRLVLASGGKTETVMGLAGVGDLVLTATGNASRNRTVGLKLAQGMLLSQILHELGHVAEGVLCAKAMLERATHLRVDTPILKMVCQVLDGLVSPKNAVHELLEREVKKEF